MYSSINELRKDLIAFGYEENQSTNDDEICGGGVVAGSGGGGEGGVYEKNGAIMYVF